MRTSTSPAPSGQRLPERRLPAPLTHANVVSNDYGHGLSVLTLHSESVKGDHGSTGLTLEHKSMQLMQRCRSQAGDHLHWARVGRSTPSRLRSHSRLHRKTLNLTCIASGPNECQWNYTPTTATSAFYRLDHVQIGGYSNAPGMGMHNFVTQEQQLQYIWRLRIVGNWHQHWRH
jgi:hypothetical protein